MWSIVQSFITPAFVSALISLWANRFLEAQRAGREHLTKLFEVAREDVRRAADAAVDYFSTPPADRSALQEAKVIAADREVRAALWPLLAIEDRHRNRPASITAAAAFFDLIAELTGGSFQASAGEVDREHIKRLVFACASMRSALAKLREDQLAAVVEADPIRSRWASATSWWRLNNPFRSNA